MFVALVVDSVCVESDCDWLSYLCVCVRMMVWFGIIYVERMCVQHIVLLVGCVLDMLLNRVFCVFCGGDVGRFVCCVFCDLVGIVCFVDLFV